MDSPIFQLIDLSFRYSANSKYILKSLNLAVKNHEFVAVLGPSGCGKTTLLNLLLGYLHPTQGKCYFNSVQLAGPASERLPIFQEDSLWPWLTASENIALYSLIKNGKSFTSHQWEKINDLLLAVGLNYEIGDTYPKQLSIGMKKRIEIARALYAESNIIIADEPFSSLDEITRTDLQDLLLSVWKQNKKTIVFSSHNLEEALYLSTRIIVLCQKLQYTEIVIDTPNELHGIRKLKHTNIEAYLDFYNTILMEMRFKNEK